jgi:hypothetical protein
MNRSAPRSIDQYLEALRQELADEDAALIQDVMVLAGVLLLTLLMHLARGVGRLHSMYAKALLVARTAPLAAMD